MDELTSPVRKQHQFDVGKLQRYLSNKINVNALTVRQYRSEKALVCSTSLN